MGPPAPTEQPPPGPPPRPSGEPPAERVPSLARSTAIMSLGTTASRLTGFLRLAVMAWAIGGAESKVPDTYNLANSLPNIVYQLVLGEVLATVFVPVFVEYIHTREREESWRLASTILNLALIVAGAFAALTVIFAPYIIKIYTFRIADPVLRAQQEAVGTFFMRLFMPQMIFYAAGAVLTGLLNAHRKFAAPMFAPVLNNVIVIGTFVGFRVLHGSRTPQLAILTGAEKWLLAGGTTLGVITFTMVLWPFVRTLPGRYRLRALEWRHPAIRHVGTLAKYSFGYVVMNQVGLWVVFALANGVKGGISAYQNAFTLYQLPYGIFAVSVMTALIPRLAEHHVRRDDGPFVEDVSLGLRTSAFVVIPAAAGMVALAHPIIRLLLQHGVFGEGSTALYADTLALMALGLAGFTAFQQLMRAFYARQDTKTPWVINNWTLGLNIALNVPLYRWLGVPGLGLAHALSFLFAAVTSGAVLRRRIGRIDGRRLAWSHARIIAAAALTALGAWCIARVLESPDMSLPAQLLQVGAAVAAGLILYVALAAAFRLDELTPLARAIAGKLARRPQEASP